MAVISSELNENEEVHFVNRLNELKELNNFKDEVVEGNGKFVLLKGEAGVGKTRLAERLMEECEEDGLLIFKGRCLYHEGTEPYLPFLDALGDYIESDEEVEEKKETFIGMGAGTAVASSDSFSTSGRPMSLIEVGTKDRGDTKNISISDEREAMFTEFLELIKGLSERKPIFLFIDDLQWIDVSSSQLLHFLARKVYDSKVFIVGAYRPEELKTREEELPLENILDRIKEERLVDIIDLERLGFQPVADMIKNRLKTKDLPESFLLMVYRESEGNPYYVIEILNSMMDEGVIDPYSYTWDPEEELTDISIPSSIKDITSRRIERLSKAEKDILMYASVIGTEFNFEILESSMDIDVIELLDVIESLQSKGLIQEIEDTEEEIYRFNHLQIRTTLYSNMGKSRKRILNKKIGDAIEEFYKDNLEEYYYSLSRHFYEGKVFDKAYEYSLNAAEQAINRYAVETALEHYERAIESLDKSKNVEDTDKKKMLHLEKIGQLSFDINKWAKGENAYNTLVEIASEMGDRKTEADALRGIAHIKKESQDFREADNIYQKALNIYEELNDLVGIADCQRGLGYLRWREGNFEEAVEHYQTSIEKGKEAGENSILALTYIEMGNTYAQKGENDLALRYYMRSLPPLKSQNAFRDLARANNNIGDQYMKKEEWDKAIEYFQKSMDNAKKIGNKRLIGWGYFNQAEALAKKGDLEKAKVYTERAEKLMENMDDVVGLSSIYRVKGIIDRMEKKYEDAIELVNKSNDLLDGYDIPFSLAENYFEFGRVYEEMDKPEKAIEFYKKAKNTFPPEAMQYIEKIDIRLDSLNIE
ncbi:MAG: tetratricopeptide repeat protein [Candidatus Saliniplasma sp.]